MGLKVVLSQDFRDGTGVNQQRAAVDEGCSRSGEGARQVFVQSTQSPRVLYERHACNAAVHAGTKSNITITDNINRWERHCLGVAAESTLETKT